MACYSAHVDGEENISGNLFPFPTKSIIFVRHYHYALDVDTPHQANNTDYKPTSIVK